MAEINVILKLSKEIKRGDIALSVARQPESTRLFVGSSDASVYDLDCAADEPVARKFEGEGHTSYVTGLVLAGEQLVSGGYDRQLIWWDKESGRKIRALRAHEKWIRHVAVSPDGTCVASVGDDMVARLWEAGTGKLKHELRGHEPMTPHHFVSMLFTCAFSPDGKLLATADKVGHVVVWDAESGKSVKTLEAPGVYTWDPQARIHSIGGARSLAFSPDGAELVVGGMGKVGNIDHLEGKARLEFFDWQKGESLAVTESDKFKGLIQELAFHPEGKWLACAGGDTKGWILFADAVTRKLVTQEPAPMHIHRFVLNEQANRLFAAGHQRLAIFEIGA